MQRGERFQQLRLRAVVGFGYFSAAGITALAVVTPDPDPSDHAALLVICGISAVLGLILTLGRRVPYRFLKLLGITGATLLTTCTLSIANPVGPTLAFYAWPAFTTGYWCGRRERLFNYAVVLGCLLVGLHLSPARDDTVPLLTTIAISNTFVVIAEMTAELTRRTESLVRQLHRAATTDSLTGLLNRGAWTEGFSAALADGGPISVVMFDLDHFKRINDRFGHDAGDQALRTFARVLADEAPQDGLVSRTGGEEFCVALPGRSTAVAAEFARGVVRRLEAETRDGDVPFTASAGIASRDLELRGSGVTDSLLISADQALYDAKRAGRNRVSISGEPPTPRSARHRVPQQGAFDPAGAATPPAG